jgi:23S rRNA-/tRNA-specific pseudouridylate synthase
MTDLGTSLTTLTVGRLVYFSENSRVAVVRMTANESSDSDVDDDMSPVAQWQLAFQRHLGKTEKRSTHETGTLIEPDSSSITTTTTATTTRFLMCGHCGKTVSKIKSMQQHQDFVHLKSTRTISTSLSLSSSVDPSIRDCSSSSSSSNNMNGTGTMTTADSSCSFSSSSNIWTRPLRVLYQDDAMVIVDKPQGMAVMGNKETLQRSNLLMPLVGTRPVDWPGAKKARTCTDDKISINNNAESDVEGGVRSTKETNDEDDHDDDEQVEAEEKEEEDKILGKPRPAHRLDAPTGGVLVLSKTQRVDSVLKRIFRDRQCRKVYRAIVHGKLIVPSTMSNNNARDDNDAGRASTIENGEYGICCEILSGKPSTTLYKPLRYGRASFVLKRSVVLQKQDNAKSTMAETTTASSSIDNDDVDQNEADASSRDSGGGGGGVCGVNDEQMGTWLTVVELKPVTGRHHQLRRHLKGLGHAIVGDSRYGPRVLSAASTSGIRTESVSLTTGDNGQAVSAVSSSKQQPVSSCYKSNDDDTQSRLCLWAMEITLPHPVTGKELCVGMDEPAWIDHVLKLEQEQWEHMQEEQTDDALEGEEIIDS